MGWYSEEGTGHVGTSPIPVLGVRNAMVHPLPICTFLCFAVESLLWLVKTEIFKGISALSALMLKVLNCNAIL